MSLLEEARRRLDAEEAAASKFDPKPEPPTKAYEGDPALSGGGSKSKQKQYDNSGDSVFVETTCAADVKPEPIRWLWPERIALGKLTVLGGDPGLGKSMVSIALAAHVTQGTPWPVDRSECPVGTVLLISAEDDVADTIRPRLDAAGADVKRVHVLTAVREPDPETGHPKARSLSLKRDLEALERKLAELKDCKLLVIDPITAYLDGTDSHKNADVRALLTPLAELAQRHGVAIVAVTHLNKGGGQSAMYRAMGSLAFVAAARAVFAVTKDANDDTRRLVLPVKNNLGDDRTGVAYRIEVADNGAPYVTWEDEAVEVSADEALAPSLPDEERTERSEAADWLREVLKDGPVGAKDLQKAAKEAGVAWRTIERSKRDAGVDVKKSPNGGPWRWSLRPPDQDRQPPPLKKPGGLGGLGGLNEKSTSYKSGFTQDRQDRQSGETGQVGGLGDEDGYLDGLMAHEAGQPDDDVERF